MIVLGCNFKIRLIFRSLREMERSVKKRLKSKSFAAGVERDEVYKGVELFGVTLEEHIQLIIDALYEKRVELDLE